MNLFQLQEHFVQFYPFRNFWPCTSILRGEILLKNFCNFQFFYWFCRLLNILDFRTADFEISLVNYAVTKNLRSRDSRLRTLDSRVASERRPWLKKLFTTIDFCFLTTLSLNCQSLNYLFEKSRRFSG